MIGIKIRKKPEGCQKAKDWVEAGGADRYRASYKEVYPRSNIRLTPPMTIDKEIHWTYLEESGERPEAFVVEIPGGRLWANEWCTDSAVITPDNKVLSDISFRTRQTAEDNPVFNRRSMPSLYSLRGAAADLTAMASSYVYFHWMFDALPRMHLLQKSGLFDGIDWFIVNQYNRPFHKETLKTLGIAEEKIIEARKHPYIKADRLLATSLLGGDNNMPGWACDFLRETFLEDNDKNRPPSKRIYISRADSGGRRVVNEEEVFALLKDYGFEKHILTGMPVAEQVKLFASAEVVIAVQGSGLTNIVFCDKGTKIIELYLPTFVEAWHWFIACHLGLRFYYIIGKGDRVTRDKWHLRSKKGNILLGTEELEETLKLAGIKK